MISKSVKKKKKPKKPHWHTQREFMEGCRKESANMLNFRKQGWGGEE